jgi:5-formyltetrahydrofolate cyclo-ligase
MARLVAAWGLLHAAKRVAVYAANDGELDPSILVSTLLRAGKTVVLPVMGKDRRLTWRRWRREPLTRNRLGIAEPSRYTPRIATRTLDLVFVPLVAFDDAGHRLGRGGGHYDATFAHADRRPKLVGLAHEVQHATELPREHWDVRLDAVITERRIYVFAPRGHGGV